MARRQTHHSSPVTHHSERRLRFAGYSPPGSVFSRAGERFKELIEAGSGGRISVDLFWNVLDFGYTAEQLVEMVDSGLLSGCYMSTSYLAGQSGIAPRLAVLDLPFLITTREQAYTLLDGPLGDEMAAEVEARSGLKHLGYWENGFRHLSNSRGPVRSPDDLTGLKVRLQPNELHQRAFRLLGAEPVLTDVADMIPALREGRVNAQENPLDNLWTYGVYQYTRYVTLSAHFFGIRGMYLNRTWFERLEPDLQQVVADAGRRTTLEQRAASARRDEEIRQKLVQAGLEIVEPSPAELAAFRRRVEPLYAEAAEMLGQEVLDRVSAARQ